LSKTSWETSLERTTGGLVFWRTRYWRRVRKVSKRYWPTEKPMMSFFHGKSGRSRKRARRCAS
jgi:hypothetical protein